MNDSGLYLLVLKLDRPQQIKIGRWPSTSFKAGYYLYIGRAKRGLQARICRHLKKTKKIFWHIDYLTRYAPIIKILIKPGAFDECAAARRLKNLLINSAIPLRRFGASDCRCQGHLLYLPASTSVKNLEELLVKVERFKPLSLSRDKITPHLSSLPSPR